MLARATVRTTTATMANQLVARRAFTTTRARLSSPYHYPEGPLSNLPFNPRTKGFAFWYWSFMATGLGLPFAVAGRFFSYFFSGRCGGARGSSQIVGAGC